MENNKPKEIRFSPKFFIDKTIKTELVSIGIKPKTGEQIIYSHKKPLSKIQYDSKTGEEIVWVRLYDYEDYEVSNFGVIRSIERSKYNSAGVLCNYPSTELKPRATKKSPNLFIEVNLGFDDWSNKLRKTIYLQKAVADHFILKPIENSECENSYEFSHNISGDYTDNSYHNIKWVTKEELIILEQKTKLKNGTIRFSSKIK